VTLQAAFAVAVVDEWVRAGVTDVIVAPGSRSTPLVLAVAASGLRVHVHLDERSAGFFALGLGLATGRPAPVVVTSGTAAAELLPSVVEAHHARVPMIVCTGDRPPELHHVGAPQSIEQGRLYEGLLRWQADVGVVGDLPSSAWRSIGARSVAAAVGGSPGPVQLNLGFREPLVGVPHAGAVPPGRSGGRPWHAVGGRPTMSVAATTEATSLVSGRTGVIVAGGGVGDPAAVLALARALGWPVLATAESGCRGPSPDGVVVAAFDPVLRALGAELRPDAVVHVGTLPASKVLSQWLTGLEAEVIVADPWGTWTDPERRATLLVTAVDLCQSLVGERPAPAPDGWGARWRSAEASAQQAISRVLARHPELTEPGIARAVTAALPGSAALMAASSMPIRDVEWFGDPSMTCRVLANRGANGIDGIVSTTLGVAAGWAGPVVGLLGDLAFLHDSGGLLGAVRRGLDCTLVVVDNDGGGIFSFLPQASLPTEQFELLWGTPHGADLADLAALARAHGLPVATVEATADVAPAVLAGVAEGGVRLVLAHTDRQANVAVHDELNAAVAGAVAGGPL
jgi:2-succinyl-5-enolpyruvyl-6-hydroxy-3-cyclohexene-1-carboxylate synthase